MESSLPQRSSREDPTGPTELQRVRMLFRQDPHADTMSPEDLDLLVEYICDGSLLGPEGLHALGRLVHRTLSVAALQHISTTGLLKNHFFREAYLQQENVPELVRIDCIRTWYLSTERMRSQNLRPLLSEETRRGMEILDRVYSVSANAAFLAQWQRIEAMPPAQREVFLTLLSDHDQDWRLPHQTIAAILDELRQASLLV